MRQRLSAFAVALAAAVATAGVVPASAAVSHSGLGIRLADAPSKLLKDPRARSYIIDHLAPGAHITRHVEVFNDTGAPAHIILYADAANISGGSFMPGGGQTANELTGWTTVAPAVMDMAQGEKRIATVDIRVPLTAARGERYGVIYAEMPARHVANGISLASRVGVRMYLDIGFGAPPPSDFRIISLRGARTPDGSPEVIAQVRNIGGRALDLFGTLLLRNGPGGLTAGPFPAQLGTTLGIGQQEPVYVVLGKTLPSGPWLAHLQLQSDLVRHAAEATISFPGAAGAQNAAVPATTVTHHGKSRLWFIIGAAVGLLAILLLFLLFRRRHRDEDDDEPSPPRQPVPAQAVPAQRAGWRSGGVPSQRKAATPPVSAGGRHRRH